MKDKFLTLFKKFIDMLLHIYEKSIKDETTSSPYHPLSPTDEAQGMEHYFDSLSWALENQDRIKNIAIAGPMGSGKSSVIQSFQRWNKNKNLRFINISLATFKGAADKDVVGSDDNLKSQDETLRLIELSILQQLFYFEEDQRIPDSRFRKIKKQKTSSLLLLTFGSILFLASLLNLVYPFFLAKILLFRIADSVWFSIHYLSLGITILGIIYLLFRSLRMLNGLVINRLSFKDAEIEIDKEISKSVLNKYIDEILYFFEATKYNVLVIEDLDRFHQTEVFTKLREINFIINNSKKVAQKVTFIYAIRDDIFRGIEKTKFFDFVIPIIPVINSSNSREQLAKIIERNNYRISADLLDNISLFIDDMRLLYNIVNEYHLYSRSLDESLSQDKLLSMMVYKNILPDDFSKLNVGEGILFDIFSSKQESIRKEIEERQKEIKQLKEKISELETIKVKTIKELRMIYLAKMIEMILAPGNRSFLAFSINGRRVDFNQAVEDNYFDHLLQHSDQPIQFFNQNNGNQNANIKFIDVEKDVDSDYRYEKREQLLRDKENKNIDFLKTEIEKLEEQKNKIREYKLQDLFPRLPLDSFALNDLHKKLIGVLLREGYIDEDYPDYISIFYEGSLSLADFRFLINVKTQQRTDFSYALNKLENLVQRINPSEFDKEFILNFHLADFLLTRNQADKKNRLFNQLKDQSSYSVKFIDEFIDSTHNIELFMKTLCANWLGIWQFIENGSLYSEENKNKYFKLIIEHADVSDIETIFRDYKNRIADHRDFLGLIKDAHKIQKIIVALKIKFSDINESSPEQLFKFVYHGNHYVINSKMLQTILAHFDAYEQTSFDTSNYSLIKSSGLQQLKDYIESNIDEYISMVYLELDSNVNEQADTLIELLNNQKILFENKKKIITQTRTRLPDVSKIDDIQIVNHLLEECKFLQTWDNLISIYAKNGNLLSGELISFLNNIDNVKILSNKKINTTGFGAETTDNFISSLLLEENIFTESYSFVLKSIPYSCETLDFSELRSPKVELLLENNLLTINKDNFKMLKEHFGKLHIKLIEADPKEFIDDISSFEINNEDILALLKSSLDIRYKKRIIKHFELSTFASDAQLLGQIGKLILDYSSFDFEDPATIKSILIQGAISPLDKVKIFNKKNGLFENTDIDEFLRSIGKPYSDIAEYGKRPLLDKNSIHKSFVGILKDKGYIATFQEEILGIRIYTFKKQR